MVPLTCIIQAFHAGIGAPIEGIFFLFNSQTEFP